MKEETLKNIASERAVLAGLITFGRDCYLEVDSLIGEDSFTIEQNKVLYRCVAKSFEQSEKIGFTEILASAQSLGLGEYIENKGFLSHIQGVTNTPVHIDNISDHAKRLKRLEFARKLQGGLRDIYKSLNGITGEESITHILGLAENPIQETCLSFIKEDDLTPKPIGDDIEEYIASLKENQGKSIGIPSGMAHYDECIGGGFRRKCVDLIAARMKTGKSVLADNVALHVALKHKIPVLMIDTEMSRFDHHNRLLANICDIEINRIAKGEFYQDPNQVDLITRGGRRIKEMPYHYINVSGQEFDSILSIMKRWIVKNVGYDENGRTNDCLIIYDYLKLMTSESITGNIAEFQALGFQITKLHNFMVENDCACLSFVQLNRDGITKESTDVISQSDRLAWIATSCTIFKDKTDEEKATDGIRAGNKKLIPLVARHGPGIGDDGYICVNMQGEFAKLTELGTIRKIKKDERDSREGFPDSDVENEDDEEDS
jgi:replicative DNA helicase